MKDIIRAADVRAVLNSQGWKVAREIAEDIVRENQEAVIVCENEEAVIRLQRKAQASREFWIEFTKALESTSRVETEDVQSICY